MYGSSLPQWFDQISSFNVWDRAYPALFLFLLGVFENRSDWSDSSQIAILLSGNYGFFNLLTFAMYSLLIDDRMLPNFSQNIEYRY